MKSEEFATATKADEARIDDTQMLSKESDAVANSSLFTFHSSLPKADEARNDDTQMLSKESDAVANSSLFTLHSSLPKAERIKSQKLIDELFSKQGSRSMVAFPVRVVYKVIDASSLSPSGFQLLVSVPKKRLHHAVDRNRVKRQLREAWRHHRQSLAGRLPEGKCLLVAFVWLSDRLYPSCEVAQRVERLVNNMASRL